MIRNWFLIAVFHLNGIIAFAQITPKDTSLPKPAIDSSVDYDSSLDFDESMFDEMKLFLDSMYSPHSFGIIAVVFNKGYYTYQSTNESESSLMSAKRTTFTPTLGYYHRSGFGITGIASFVNDRKDFSYYQFALTPSYDYLDNKKFATGIGYTRYFTKDSLPFYTSPLQNEVSAYFTVRKWWFKPIVTISYGWGNRSEYEQRQTLIEDLRLRPRGFTYVSNSESIVDFTLTTSIRHDFYWLDVFAFNDHIRLTPQLTFTSGSQKFGFNESSNTYGVSRFTGSNVLYSSENYYLDGRFLYQPLALTFYLRPEYAIGKFYIQPQFILDYYFPATDRQLNTFFSLNTGFVF
jgi:hypothetical protein